MDNVRILKTQIIDKCNRIKTINFSHSNTQIPQT